MTELPRTIHDLEQEFARLSVEIPESPTKRAISVLHGIVMEMWRDRQDGYAQSYGWRTFAAARS